MARSNLRYEQLSENSPLLPSTPRHTQIPDQPPPRIQSWQTPERLTLVILLAVLLFSLGDQWMDSPQTRIFEAIICYRYYEKVDPSKLLVGREGVGPGAIGGVAEMWCKADAVQSDLAALRGWQNLFDGLPALFLAVPLGWAADKFGRKPIVLLGVAGFVLRALWIQLVTWFWQAFNVRWVWLSTVFNLPGGGSSVLASTIFVIVSDVNPEAKRAAVFLRLGAFNLLAGLVMPPLAALLMEVSPWIPNLGGTFLQLLSGCMLPFIPETLNYRHSSLPHRFDPPPPEQSPVEPFPAFFDPDASRFSTAMIQIRNWTTNFMSSFSFLTDDWRIPAIILPFLSHILTAIMGQQILLQYVSRRYGIKLSKAILLATIRMGVIVLLLFFILPYISNAVIRRYRLSAERKDLYLSRMSFVLLAAGWTLVGLAPNIPLVAIALAISSLGYGAWLLLRSFLTSLVPKHYIARVYSILSIADTLGVMIGSPLVAELFSRGLVLGGFWIGLPFYFLGIVSGCFSVLMCGIGLRKGEDERSPANDDDE